MGRANLDALALIILDDVVRWFVLPNVWKRVLDATRVAENVGLEQDLPVLVGNAKQASTCSATIDIHMQDIANRPQKMDFTRTRDQSQCQSPVPLHAGDQTRSELRC